MGILDFVLSFLLCIFVIAGLCYLFQIRLKGFVVLGLNAIAGFNLTILLSFFGLASLTGMSGLLSSIFGPVGSLFNLTSTLIYG